MSNWTTKTSECAKEGSDGEQCDLAGVEVNDVEDLYRSSKVKCGVMCREVPRTKDVKRLFLAGKLVQVQQ